MFTSEYSDRFTLICTHFAYVSALWGPLRGPSHLFDPFLILCIYFYIVLVCVWSTVGESTSFSVLGSFIISSFRIRSEKDSPCNYFPYSINNNNKNNNKKKTDKFI
jgi:hypothetical protein